MALDSFRCIVGREGRKIVKFVIESHIVGEIIPFNPKSLLLGLGIFLFIPKNYLHKNKHMFENTLFFCYTNHTNSCVLNFVKASCLAL